MKKRFTEAQIAFALRQADSGTPVGEMMDETVVIQGHAIRFATVDLAAPAGEIRKQLPRMVDFHAVAL